MSRLPRLRRRHAATGPAALLLLTALLTTGPPVTAQVPSDVAVTPAAGSVHPAGAVTVAATLPPGAEDERSAALLSIDGTVMTETDDVGTRTLSTTARLAPGVHTAELHAPSAARRWTFAVATTTVQRWSGPDRRATAVAVADALVDAPAPAAVLVRDDAFADAVSGSVLASAAGGPLLLSASRELPEITAEALGRLVAPGGTVYVIGGHAAIAPPVADRIRSAGFDVVRLSGRDRSATSVAVAEAVTALVGPSSTVVLASNAGFADALAASVPAGQRGWPVLLTAPDGLDESVARRLAEHRPARIELVGGTRALTAAVATDAATAAGLPVTAVRRTGGPNRAATAALLADRFGPWSSSATLASGSTFADGLVGSVLATRRDAPLLLTDARLPDATATALEDLGTEDVLIVGGAAAVGPRVIDDALLRLADADLSTSVTPAPGSRLDAAAPGTFRVEVPDHNGALDASFSVDGREVPTRIRTDGDMVLVEVTGAADRIPDWTTATGRLQVVAARGGAGPALVDADYDLRRLPSTTTTAEGWSAVASEGAVVGSGGPVRRYSLEVEPQTGVDVHTFARQAESILSDPRGWTAGGDRRLQRVAPGDAEIRVLLATPATVDRLCGAVGLGTGGVYSCWTGRYAALNLDRWSKGAAPFDAPLDVYRGYLVNHEVGHGLGYGHRGCPSAGAPGPVMMQQTKGTGACLPNAWPHP